MRDKFWIFLAVLGISSSLSNEKMTNGDLASYHPVHLGMFLTSLPYQHNNHSPLNFFSYSPKFQDFDFFSLTKFVSKSCSAVILFIYDYYYYWNHTMKYTWNKEQKIKIKAASQTSTYSINNKIQLLWAQQLQTHSITVNLKKFTNNTYWVTWQLANPAWYT